MAATTSSSYTTYVPGIPLQEQLESLSKPTPIVTMVFGAPFKTGEVKFKPLKVNEQLLDLTLTLGSGIGCSEENRTVVYDKYTFTIKGNDFDLSDIPDNKMEQVMEVFTQEQKVENIKNRILLIRDQASEK